MLVIKRRKIFAADNIIYYQNLLFNKQIFLYLLKLIQNFAIYFIRLVLNIKRYPTPSYTSSPLFQLL